MIKVAAIAIDNTPNSLCRYQQSVSLIVYHLWAIVNGQEIACIQFMPEADGQVILQWPVDRCPSVEFERNEKPGFQALRFLKVLLLDWS